MATKAEVERIRSMQEKGMISAEQAEELIEALSEGEDFPEAQGPGASGQEGRNGEPESDNHRSEDPGWSRGEDRSERRQQSRSERRFRRHFDTGWVDDMVSSIRDSVSKSMDSRAYDPKTGRYDYTYWYGYDPSPTWGKVGGNEQNLSRVEQPEGVDFEFKDNRISFSKLHSIRLSRSKVVDNSFSASTVHTLELVDSAMEKNTLTGASLHGLRMAKAELKDDYLAGSKLTRLELAGDSALKDTRITGCNFSGVSMLEASRIEGASFAGANLSNLSLSAGGRIEKSRFSGSNVHRMALHGSSIEETEVSGSNLVELSMSESQMSDCVLRGVDVNSFLLTDSRMEKCELIAVGMDDVSLEKSRLKNVVFRHRGGHHRRQVDKLTIAESSLEDCEFANCIMRNTTIRGIKASGFRIHDKDLSGMTIQRIEDLEALSKE